jgi:hypothetical protein
VIKRIWLLDAHRSAAVTSPAAAARLAEALSAATATRARPARATIATVLRDVTPAAPYDVVGLAWFHDGAHLARFDRWLTSSPHADLAGGADAVTLIATEQVRRGADWLTGHWEHRGTAFKHMALARRAAGLSREEFSARWSAHAGQVGGTPIPEPVKGLAYVQNHPLATTQDGEPPYDAVNEVYFTDLDGLRTRVEWFADSVAAGGTGGGHADDLVAENWFLAIREDLLAA